MVACISTHDWSLVTQSYAHFDNAREALVGTKYEDNFVFNHDALSLMTMYSTLYHAMVLKPVRGYLQYSSDGDRFSGQASYDLMTSHSMLICYRTHSSIHQFSFRYRLCLSTLMHISDQFPRRLGATIDIPQTPTRSS